MNLYIDLLVRIVILVAATLAARYLIPYLKDRGLYTEICRLVAAAEKWAENHDIDKNAWVCAALAEAGVKVTPQVRRWIEAAVMELDLAMQ